MIRNSVLVAAWSLLSAVGLLAQGQPARDAGSTTLAGAVSSSTSNVTPRPAVPPSPPAADLGIEFVEGSTTTLVLEREGKRYRIDLLSRSVREVDSATDRPLPATGSTSVRASSSAGAAPVRPPQEAAKPVKRKVYRAGDDQLFSLPTGRPMRRHGMTVNFTHRFALQSAFKGRARGATLLGLDDLSISAFGFRYGVTDRLSVFVYRAPSFIGRPIELMAAYNILDESRGAPFNSVLRFSVDGQDNFRRNFTTNFELIMSRSLASRAQIYLVPTVSLHNRPVVGVVGAAENPPPYQPCNQVQANGLFGQFPNVKPCADTFTLGVGMSVDIRPTLAILAEAHPVLVNGPELGIHRAAFAFGIQKKIWRHAFTFGFSNSPGTTVAQRVGTRATYLGQPDSDTPARVFVGFDLTRQLR